jgi:uncharacterized protein YecE (DUF72 family)
MNGPGRKHSSKRQPGSAGRGKSAEANDEQALLAIPEPDPERLRAASELSNRAPEPARVGNVLFGTAGWTDRTLIKSKLFYPPHAKSAPERLAHYASHFPLVEVDATYYALLPPETSQRWAATTPGNFRFDVKAHPVLTGHPVDVSRLPRDLKQELERMGHARRVYPERLPDELRTELETRFAKTLDPLIAAGKLSSVFVQFPPWFTATRGNVRRIEVLAERWAGLPMAVEFRHTSWLVPERRERVLELLRRLELAYVCVDEPQVEGAVPPVVEVTSSALAVIRFHGHNASGWQLKGASVYQRFDWLYTPEELAAWVAPIRRLSSQTAEVHAVFNNCVRNYAVINAKGLSVLLETASA